MMFRTHILFALFFYFLFLKIFSFDFSIMFALALCFGAILPDIDSPRSYVNRKYLIGIGKGIALFSEHRGFFHSIFGLLIFFILSLTAVYLVDGPIILSLALPVGYFLHLMADSFNVSGIRWFWKSGHVKGKISTGTLGEQIFFIFLLFATIYVLKP